MLGHVWNWLLVVTGSHIPPGQYSTWYNFWSGFFSDITIFAAGIGLYFHRMCHDETCHKWGRHTLNGSPYCKKHKNKLIKEKK